jgi:predicted DNA-binding WGR domain protein
MSYEELIKAGFVIDEIYPRCMGKNLTDPRDIAVFLAKVFDYRNTQLLLKNNERARYYNINTEEHEMLINSNKNGKVTESAKENFDKIIPNEEAVSYMLKRLDIFMEKEPV